MSSLQNTTAAGSSTALQSISGLASGLDTSSIISALMAVASQPELAIKNQITIQQDKQNAYQSVLAELNTLTTSYQALTDVTTWAPVQSVNSTDSNVSATITGGAAAGAYDIGVTQLARANQFTSGGAATAAAADVLHITTSAGTTNITVNSGDSLSTIANRITQTAGSPVYATLLNGQLVLSNKQTGTAAEITGVTTNGTSGFTFSETQTAQDANFTINSKSYTSGSNIVTTALAGVTLTLAGHTASTTVTIGEPTPNTSSIETALTNFVNEYNTVVGDIETRLNEQPVPNPSNPTDDATGVLYNDQGLERLLSNLRNSVSDLMTGGGAFSSLAQVGLSTGAAVGNGSISQASLDGKLTIDTSKFESALNTNFDAVKALFTNATGKYATEGLGQRLNTILNQYTSPTTSGGYLNSAIDSGTTQITELQSQVTNWQQRLALKQQMLQTEFTNMETALSQAQSVGSQLSQQISSLGSSGG
ncbi:MAG TPA: flagellar filament capping protein FliD [Gaiellaceae bacterium]|nr:flagellar filament capping protein FliD [Gaiellaceae bacterium]